MKRWLELLRFIAPIIVMTAPNAKVREFGPKIIDAIESAEKLKNAPGSEKRAHAQDLVAEGAQIFNDTRKDGEVTVNVDEIRAASGNLIDGIVGAINAVERAEPAMPQAPVVVADATGAGATDLPKDC